MIKVLLLEHVPNVGKKWDIVDLKEGYASNFIFPKKLGKSLSPKELQKVLEDREKHEENAKKLIVDRREIADKMHNQKVLVKREAVADKLKERITQKDIAAILNRKFGVELSKKHIEILQEGHIHHIGEHIVSVKLGDDVFCRVILEVVAK